MQTSLLPLFLTLAARPSVFPADKASAKEKTNVVDRILGHIEAETDAHFAGGLKLRKWYGTADFLSEDVSVLGVDAQEEVGKDMSSNLFSTTSFDIDHTHVYFLLEHSVKDKEVWDAVLATDCGS